MLRPHAVECRRVWGGKLARMWEGREFAVVVALLSMAGWTHGCAGLSDAQEMEGEARAQDHPLIEESTSSLTSSNTPAPVWKYISFPDTSCRDGSPAGISISKSTRGSKKLMIFLEGGGICFDAQTCGENPANTQGQQGAPTSGIFDRSNAANPVRDWNFVYVPYCTGDLHAGARRDVDVPGVGTQQFVGALNMQRFLKTIVSTFCDSKDVLLTGSSAGGFGAVLNFVQVQNAAPGLKVNLIDDSGPLLNKMAAATCLQALWRTSFGFEQTFLAGCGSSCPNKSDYLQDYLSFLAKKYSDRPLGLIESAQDEVISEFLGIGSNNCTGTFATPISGSLFETSLLQLRSALTPYPSFSVYIPTGTQHQWLEDPSFYSEVIGTKKLSSWFGRIANGTVPGNVGP
ncbi:MAG: Phage tail length tape-measure protein [Myxococcaceae bacterium]|nr:Phage tail length tape-measure protein [Myxococcaceae bacterium]